jgi:hypothetical protein
MWYVSKISNATHNVEICRHSGEKVGFVVPAEFQSHDKKLKYIASQMDVQEVRLSHTVAVPTLRFKGLIAGLIIESAALVSIVIWRLF